MSKTACLGLFLVVAVSTLGGEPPGRTYDNRLIPLVNPKPLLADYPEFVEPIQEEARFEAPVLVDDPGADLDVRAWRFSYNARGVIEVPNRLKASQTAIIVVHPWGIDDGGGWKTPEPAGVAFACTLEKNRICREHAGKVINPFLKSLRGKVSLVAYSLPGREDPIRKDLYRSMRARPSEENRRAAAAALSYKLGSFPYDGSPLPPTLALDQRRPATAEYFRQFPGLDAGAKFNHEGFWDLPIPVTRAIDVAPEDVVIYDAEGYEPLRKFLKDSGIRHVLLAGYHLDMCVCETTAGYKNLAPDFNVFLVGDATLATFPANTTPRVATSATLSKVSLNQFITQVSWVQPAGKKN